jgi:iron complex outermembrane receptor protein
VKLEVDTLLPAFEFPKGLWFMFKTHRLAGAVAAISCALATSTVTAQSEGKGADLPNIVVIGVRETPMGRDVLELDEQAGRPAADGADLLRSVNGLSLGRFGGRGLEPTLRGQSQGRVNVLLDGAYVHGGCPNRMDPPTSFASVNTYERIIVLKGVQTLRYGGGGSGGTLLFERENEPTRDGFSGGLRAGASSNGLRSDIALEMAWAGEAGYLRANLEQRDADSYEDGDGNEVRSAFEEDSFYIAGGLRLRDQDRLELALEKTRTDDALFPGAGMDAPMDESEQYRLRYQGYDLAAFDTLSIELYRTDVEHLMDNYSNRPLMAPAALRVPSQSETNGVRIIGEFRSSGVDWTMGADFQGRQRTATRYMGPDPDNVDTVNAYMWPDASLDQFGLFGEAQFSLDNGARMTAGLRYDRVEADADAVDSDPPSPMLGSPNALYTQYYGLRHEGAVKENNIGALLRIDQRINDHWTGFAGLSRTVRTADSTERFLAAANPMPAMRWVGNPGLDPETHHQADAGVVYSVGAHRVDAVVFYDDVADYILRDRAHGQDDILASDNATVYRNVDARLYGVESSWEWDIGGGWQASASLAWVRARNTDESRDIAQTPPLNGGVRLSYAGSTWDAGANLRWSDRQTRVEDNPMLDSGLDAGETPGWGVLDLYAKMQLGALGELHAGVDNVFDRTYAEHLNRGNRDPFYPEALQVNEPGRVIWARYEYRF